MRDSLWSSERWWPSSQLLPPQQIVFLDGEWEGIARLECPVAGSSLDRQLLFLPLDGERHPAFASLELLQLWWKRAGWSAPKSPPFLLETGSSNPLVRWGEFFLKYRVVPQSGSASRERRFFSQLSESRLTPRLIGELFPLEGEPLLLVMEWVPGKSLWNEIVEFSSEERRKALPLLLEESVERVGELHRILGGGWVDGRPWGKVHADLHLGQLLRSPSRELLLLDFEGLPGQNSEDESLLLDDLAALWRSADYLLTFCHEEVGELLSLPLAERLLEKWSRALGESFYSHWSHRSSQERLRWFASAVVRRNLWELKYEELRRPNWLAIPQAGWPRSLELLQSL